MPLIKTVVGVECEECANVHYFGDENNRVAEVTRIGWSIEALPAILATYYYCPTCTKKRRENDAGND